MDKKLEKYLNRLTDNIESLELEENYTSMFMLTVKFRSNIRCGFESTIVFTVHKGLIIYRTVTTSEILGEDFTDILPLSFLSERGIFEFIFKISLLEGSVKRGFFTNPPHILKISNKYGFEVIKSYLKYFKYNKGSKLIMDGKSDQFNSALKNTYLETKLIHKSELESMYWIIRSLRL